MKQCKMCGFSFREDEFYKNGPRRRPECKYCTKSHQRAATHGVTRDDLLSRYLAQKGRCAICLVEAPIGSLVVDHDHKCCPYEKNGRRTCGKCIRGLLCPTCNQGIGLLKEDKDVMLRAVEYLGL